MANYVQCTINYFHDLESFYFQHILMTVNVIELYEYCPFYALGSFVSLLFSCLLCIFNLQMTSNLVTLKHSFNIFFATGCCKN